MKRLFTFFILLCALSSCAEKDKTIIRIKAANYNADTIDLVWFDGSGNIGREAVALSGGNGSATLELPAGQKISLISRDASNLIEVPDGTIPGPGFSFYTEQGKITISFDNDQWPAVTISGGRLNDDVNRYWAKMGPLEKRIFDIRRETIAKEESDGGQGSAEVYREQETVTNEFISQNPDSELALELLQGQFIELELDEFENRYLDLSERVRNTPEGIAVAEKIAKARSLSVGYPAPLFTKTDSRGNKISLADYRGKWVMLDFWGTWCGPCRKSHPHLIELYRKYSPEDLVLISVAWEYDTDPQWRAVWLDAIEKDGLTWTNIADNEFPAEGSITGDYQISVFPTKVLIDPEGALAGIFPGGNVDAKLAEIFGTKSAG